MASQNVHHTSLNLSSFLILMFSLSFEVQFILLPGMEPLPTADPALSYPSPADLRFSELGSRQVKLHWTNPAKPVQQYRVVYHSADSQSPQEVRNTITSSANRRSNYMFNFICFMLLPYCCIRFSELLFAKEMQSESKKNKHIFSVLTDIQ